MSRRYAIRVNGEGVDVEAEPDTPVLWVLRDRLGLLGTKYGCGRGFCGACTIHLDGTAVASCLVSIEDVDDSPITTIEGLGAGDLHPAQRAWIAERVPQCGYCQAGQIMRAAALLERVTEPSDEEIVAEMSRNLCRCGTYSRIVRAVRRAAEIARDPSG